jgi:hypothetical protein
LKIVQKISLEYDIDHILNFKLSYPFFQLFAPLLPQSGINSQFFLNIFLEDTELVPLCGIGGGKTRGV